MYVKKIVSVDNVGRLASCTQKGPEFKKYNLLFAENGRGKTTLCAVLRSLQTGQHEHITERKRIAPVTGEPEAVIRLESGEARYRKQAWNTTAPDIAIFDSTFVARNVHAGEYVDRDHRTNLLEIIIGDAGVTLANKVGELDAAIRQKNSDVGRARKAVEAQLPKGLGADLFVAFPKDADIDTKIKSAEGQLKTANEAENIKKRTPLSAVAIPALPPNWMTILAKTLDDVSVDAEQRLRAQLAKHNMLEHGEGWISEGLGFIKDDACPFCGQDITGVELIPAYQQYFSQAYADFIAEIDQAERDLTSVLGETSLEKLAGVVATNDAALAFWNQYAAIEIDALDYQAQIAPSCVALYEAARALISKKRGSPLEPCADDETLKAALAQHKAARAVLSTYNTQVAAGNALIDEKKKGAAGANIALIQQQLEKLKLRKLRYEPKVEALCNDFKALSDEKKALDKDKETAKAELDTHADAMIGHYETTINKLLQGFGAGFQLTNSKKTYIGGKPSSAYQILINDQPVDLGDSSTPLGHPSFRTTLSAGDKSTLALAFFLAQLDHDPKKAERIIVFDDPFNSQDRSRRNRTAELLKKYGSECQQLVLLSHDPHFLNLVNSKLPKAERHCLQLSRVPENCSTIEEWDIAKETQEGYFKDHAALSSYLLNGAVDLIDIVRKIRPVLEGYMRYRFPNAFPPNKWLGDMIKHVRDEGAVHPMHSALAELEGINDYSKKYHHDSNPGKADAEPIDDGELTAFVRRTLAIVGGY